MRSPSASLYVIAFLVTFVHLIHGSQFATPATVHWVYEGCSTTKGCFATPYGCLERHDCQMMTTFRQDSEMDFEIEIYGRINQANADGYVAVAFSKDDFMKDDMVIQCVNHNNQLTSYMAENTAYSCSRWTNPHQGLELMNATFCDGYLYCKVHRVNNMTSKNFDFDLRTPHYLLMAKGSLSGYLDEIMKHDDVLTSRQEIDFTKHSINGVVESTKSDSMKKLHGSLMVIAWLLSASFGTFIPTFLKSTAFANDMIAKNTWLFIHHVLMVVTWILTMTAFTVIFIDVGGWQTPMVAGNPHPLLGYFTTVLAFLQPFVAILRPTSNSQYRLTFDRTSSVLGYSAHILAIACMFLAVDLKAATLPDITYLMLAFHICMYLMMHALFRGLAKRQIEYERDFERDASQKSPIESDKLEKASMLKRSMLMVYGAVIAALTMIVVTLIYTY